MYYLDEILTLQVQSDNISLMCVCVGTEASVRVC